MFITNGPPLAIGSPIGLPAISKNSDFFGGGNSGLDVADTDDGGDGGSGLGTGGGDDDLDINTDRDENDWQDTKGTLKG